MKSYVARITICQQIDQEEISNSSHCIMDLHSIDPHCNRAHNMMSIYVDKSETEVRIVTQPITHYPQFKLTHWDRVTHICISKLTIIGSDNGLLPGQRQAIIWTNARILLIGLTSLLLQNDYTWSWQQSLCKYTKNGNWGHIPWHFRLDYSARHGLLQRNVTRTAVSWKWHVKSMQGNCPANFLNCHHIF